MKEFKGTKEKWFAARDANGLGVFTEREKICTLYEHRHSGEEVDANARLITSAPELLKALQTLVELRNKKLEDGKWEGYLEERQIAWDNAEKEINKALGL